MTQSFHAMMRRVELEADRLIRALGVTQPADLQRLDDLAEILGIEVHYGGLSGAAARLVKRGDSSVLRVREADKGTPRGRFSVAHEIGHHRLHQAGSEAWCTHVDMSSWHLKKVRETEANAFASAFLLPSALVSDQCDCDEVSLKVPISLARDFDVSLTASAIRFVRLCAQPCAVVVATGGRVDYAVRNDDFWPWIPAGEPLHHATLAHDCHKYQSQRYPDPETVPAHSWVRHDHLDESLELVEHTLYRPGPRQSITLLWAKDWPLEDEMVELAETEER